MKECARKFFSFNGQLKPVAEFEKFFTQPEKYIYEVFRVQQGIPLFINDHLNRLWSTAELEDAGLPFSRQEVMGTVFSVIRANPGGDGNIKIFINLPANGSPTWMVYFNPHQYPSIEQFEKGVAVSLFFAERHNPNAKVMDTSLRAATNQAKNEDDVYEVLLVDRDGNITEGSRSNVFFILNQKLITPPVRSVLEGITQKHIMQLCAENEIPVSEKTVHKNDLITMEAVFITGTSRRVLPVNRIDNLVFDVSHTLIRKLQRLLEERVRMEFKQSRESFSWLTKGLPAKP